MSEPSLPTESRKKRRLTAAYLDKVEAMLQANVELLSMQTQVLAALTEEVKKLTERVSRIQPVVINSWTPVAPTKPEAAPNQNAPQYSMTPIGIRLNGT